MTEQIHIGRDAGKASFLSMLCCAVLAAGLSFTAATSALAGEKVAMTLAMRAQQLGVKAPRISSDKAVVIDQRTGNVLYEKNADTVSPIASITKLMTAMVVIDSDADMNEMLTVTKQDIDTVKRSRSRLPVGSKLKRSQLLRLALMASENRAASALARHHAGGAAAFVAAMNRKAGELRLDDTVFHDATGLSPKNVSSARDLVRLVDAAHQYSRIRNFTTSEKLEVVVKGRKRTYRNTNSLVRSDAWRIGLSKTGYISEAGKCLVMQAWLNDTPTIIVLLDSWGRKTRLGDANRIRRWMEKIVNRDIPLSS